MTTFLTPPIFINKMSSIPVKYLANQSDHQPYFEKDDKTKVDCYQKEKRCGAFSLLENTLVILSFLASVYFHMDCWRTTMSLFHRLHSIPPFNAPPPIRFLRISCL